MFKYGTLSELSLLYNKYTKMFFVCALSLFILFNSFSFSAVCLATNVDFSQIIDVQKDVFSAVFTVSSMINEINNSFCGNIGISNHTSKDNTTQKDIPSKNKSVIMSYDFSFEKKELGSSLNFLSGISIKINNFTDNIYSKSFKWQQNIFFVVILYFMTMLCFFASANKVYNKKNLKNIYVKVRCLF